MIRESLFLIKKDIMNLRKNKKFMYIRLGLITISNLAINLKLGIPFFYAWGFPAYYYLKLEIHSRIRQYFNNKFD